jgi:hypothetical protein
MAIHDDRVAGLRLRLPHDWKVGGDKLIGPFTCLANRPKRTADPDDPEATARVMVDVQRLWDRAADPGLHDLDLDLDELDPPTEHACLAVGVFGLVNTDDELGPPIPGDLLDAADWLAATYGTLLDFRPSGQVRSKTRPATLDGRPAAETTRAYVAGHQSGYLRIVVVDLPGGRLSFALGIAVPDDERHVIDAILDGLRPLS